MMGSFGVHFDSLADEFDSIVSAGGQAHGAQAEQNCQIRTLKKGLAIKPNTMVPTNKKPIHQLVPWVQEGRSG